eukprot:6421-Heterococcus_DN1.PRE.4
MAAAEQHNPRPDKQCMWRNTAQPCLTAAAAAATAQPPRRLPVTVSASAMLKPLALPKHAMSGT